MKVIALKTDNKIAKAFNKNKSLKPIWVDSVEHLFTSDVLLLNQAVFVCSQESTYQKIRSFSVFTPVLMYKSKKLDPLASSFYRYIDLEDKASELMSKALFAKTHMVNELNLRSDKFTRLFLKAKSLDAFLDQLFTHFSQILEVENITWVSDVALQESEAENKNLTNSYCYNYNPSIHLRDLRASSHQEILNFIKSEDIFNSPYMYVYKIEGCGQLIFGTSSSWIDATYKSVKASMDSLFSPLLAQHFQIKKSEAKARIDNLTGLFNYRFLNETLWHWTQSSKQLGFATLFIDLDYFKNVNDSHGHMVGSKTLVEFSNELFDFLKDQGLGIRYGGDEFVVLLEKFTLEQATEFAESFRQHIESKSFIIDGHKLKLTVSIGVAIFPDHAKNPDKILDIADQAMYFGKQKSRNITYIAS